MWTAQRKFCVQHLRKLGFCGDVMEKNIIEEVNDLILNITRKYEVYVLLNVLKIHIKE